MVTGASPKVAKTLLEGSVGVPPASSACGQDARAPGNLQLTEMRPLVTHRVSDSGFRKHSPHRLAVIGLGGYAGIHHSAAVKLEREGCLRLTAACDPAVDRFAERMAEWDFSGRRVRVFSDYRAMLDQCAGDLDWVVIPTPIPLHAEMHRECVRRDLSVYLEKPPTLDPAELEAMIAADQTAARPANVGFNFIIQPERQALKKRLLAGDFGDLIEVRFFGEWGRTSAYFQRSGWAGKLLGPDGRPLLDSCFGNAMAHFVHNSLFWAGTKGLHDWAVPGEAKAKLFHVHKIEGPDTVFVECLSATGTRLRFAMTHACPPGNVQREEVVCARATVRFVVGSHYEIVWRDGRTECRDLPEFDAVTENQRAYCAFLRGEVPRPSTTLQESRPFVHLNALMYLSAAAVEDFPAELVRDRLANDGQTWFYSVDGLAGAMERFLENGVWPEWGGVRSPTPATPRDLPRLVDTLRAMNTPASEAHAQQEGLLLCDFSGISPTPQQI